MRKVVYICDKCKRDIGKRSCIEVKNPKFSLWYTSHGEWKRVDLFEEGVEELHFCGVWCMQDYMLRKLKAAKRRK